MNKRILLAFFLFVFFGGISFSQSNYSLFGSPKPSLIFGEFNFTSSFSNKIKVPQKPSGLFFQNAPQFSFRQNNNLYYFKYEIPKGAVFCRMENQLRNTFNIWIKVRAGTDESYNSIRPQ